MQFDPSRPSTAADLTSEAGPSARPSTSSLPPLSPALPAPVRPLPPTASISDLRARLHSKIDGFRRDRGIDDNDPQSRDALEAETRRRRGEMRDRRRNERKEERRREREKDAVSGKTAKVRCAHIFILCGTGRMLSLGLLRPNSLSRRCPAKVTPSHSPMSNSHPPHTTRTTSK